jgi:hypothetical protein
VGQTEHRGKHAHKTSMRAASRIKELIHIGAIGFDAGKHIALARIERRPARLDLSAHPHRPRMEVKTTCAADNATLLPELAV